jgi:hypothetical protein
MCLHMFFGLLHTACAAGAPIIPMRDTNEQKVAKTLSFKIIGHSFASVFLFHYGARATESRYVCRAFCRHSVTLLKRSGPPLPRVRISNHWSALCMRGHFEPAGLDH